MHNKPKGIKDLTRRVWGKKLPLALLAHTLGGMGIGILIAAKGADQHVLSLAYVLILFSIVAHLHAFLNMRLSTRVPLKEPQNP